MDATYYIIGTLVISLLVFLPLGRQWPIFFALKKHSVCDIIFLKQKGMV